MPYVAKCKNTENLLWDASKFKTRQSSVTNIENTLVFQDIIMSIDKAQYESIISMADLLWDLRCMNFEIADVLKCNLTCYQG